MASNDKVSALDALGLEFNTSGTTPAVSAQDMARAGESVSENQSKLVNDQIQTREAAKAASSQLEAILGDMETQLITSRDAEIKAADIRKEVQVTAAEDSKGAIQQYNEAINSESADKRLKTLLERERQAAAALAENHRLQQEGNFLQRNVTAPFVEGNLRKELYQAQNELNRYQQMKANYGRSMSNSAASARLAAVTGKAEDLAEQQRVQEVAAAHISALRSKGTLKKQQLDLYATELNISNNVMTSLNKELDTLIKTNRGTEAAFAAAYQKAQMDSFEEKIAKEKVSNEKMTKDLNKYFEVTGKQDMIGRMSWEEFKKNDTGQLPMFQRWWTSMNTEGKAVWSNLVLARETRGLNDRELNLDTFVKNAVRDHNAMVMQQVSELQHDSGRSLTPQEMEQRAAKDLLNIEDPQHRRRIDQMIATKMKLLERDATPAIQYGTLLLNDKDDVFAQAPLVQQEMQTQLPTEAFSTFTDVAFKDIDWSIKPANPAGSIDGIIDSAAIALEEIAAKDLEQQERLTEQLAKAAAKFYEQQRIQSANITGFTSLPSISIRGVSSRTPGATDAMSGLGATETMNIENPAEWRILINRALRKRRIEQQNINAAAAAQLTGPAALSQRFINPNNGGQ